jgi:hypothetical protein
MSNVYREVARKTLFHIVTLIFRSLSSIFHLPFHPSECGASPYRMMESIHNDWDLDLE